MFYVLIFTFDLHKYLSMGKSSFVPNQNNTNKRNEHKKNKKDGEILMIWNLTNINLIIFLKREVYLLLNLSMLIVIVFKNIIKLCLLNFYFTLVVDFFRKLYSLLL